MKRYVRLLAILFTSCGFASGQRLNDGLVADFQMTADEFMISRINGEGSNELRWDLQHEGKIFRITGQVTRVMRTTAKYGYSEFSKDKDWAKEIDKRIEDAELFDQIALGLDVSKAENQNNGHKSLRIELHFSPEYERTLSTLRPSDTIEILGRYITKKHWTGGIGPSVLGPNCKILKVTRDGTTMPVHATPLPEVVEVEPKYDDLTNVTAEKSLTATELFNTFYRDETGNDLYLESEWSGKVVKITGEVALVEQGRKRWISDYADPGTSWGAWIKKGEQPDRYVSVKLRVDTIDKRFKVKIEGRTVTLNFDKKHLGDLINLKPGDKITAKGRVLLGHGFVYNLTNCRVYGIELQLGPTCAIVPERERDNREDHEALDVKRKDAKPSASDVAVRKVDSKKWAAYIDANREKEFDYDVWDVDKMMRVDFKNDSRIYVSKDSKGNYAWTRGGDIATVKLIDEQQSLYVVTYYFMNGVGEYKPYEFGTSPVQLKTERDVLKAAYDRIMGSTEKWAWEYCLQKALERKWETEEGEED